MGHILYSQALFMQGFVFLGAICAYEKSCFSLRADFECTANLHLLSFSFPSLCLSPSHFSSVSQFSGWLDGLREALSGLE